MVLVVFSVMFGLLFAEGQLEENLTHIRQRDGFHKARQVCALRGQSLVPSETLRRYIVESNLDMLEGTYWLALVRKTLKTWQTLSGDPYGKEIVDERFKKEGQDCGIVHVFDKIVDSSHCNNSLEGYVCSKEGNANCLADAGCFFMESRTNRVFHGKLSWNEAENDCQRRNSTLAEFTAASEQKFIERLKPHTSNHNRYAVGIRKGKWISMSTVNLNEAGKKINHWAKNEPSVGKSCAVIHTQSLKWRATNCNEKHNYVCYNKNEYSGWSDWSSCSDSYGGGTQERMRQCVSGNCSNPLREKRMCNSHICDSRNLKLLKEIEDLNKEILARVITVIVLLALLLVAIAVTVTVFVLIPKLRPRSRQTGYNREIEKRLTVSRQELVRVQSTEEDQTTNFYYGSGKEDLDAD